MEPKPIEVRPVEVWAAERSWPLFLPFHYGKVTVEAFTEIHLRLLVELGDGQRVHGYAAEIAAPKWFEKQPKISAADSVDRLRLVVRRAAALSLEVALPAASVSALADELSTAMAADGALAAVTPLERSFGMAMIERAMIDALCRAATMPFERAVELDLFGAAAMAGPEYRAWLVGRGPTPKRIAVRHTVGLDDPLDGLDGPHPVSLPGIIDTYGVTSFKVKFNETAHALDRLEAIAAVLDSRLPGYRVTLDANEAFDNPEGFGEAMVRMGTRRGLSRFVAAIAYVEQPLHRALAESFDMRGLKLPMPVMIDESDGDEEAFRRALALGYRGVSIKTCKGVLRGLRNAARAWAQDGFVAAEDLCVQPGLGLQQNLATAAAVRVLDCERNGHHFGPGPAHLPAAERAYLLSQHGDVYASDRLRIEGGRLALGSAIQAEGFGTALVPQLVWGAPG